jgi:ABC-type Fe3+/spermidine/putrescine transport system ATPase subunit
VALARALAIGPRVLLLDEPFSNVDQMLRQRLYERLAGRLADLEMTTLIATHDHREAFYFSDRVLVLDQGAVVDDNPPRVVYEQPRNAWVAGFFGAANLLTGRELGSLGDAGPPAGSVRSIDYYGFYQDLVVALDRGAELRVREAGAARLVPGDRVALRLREDALPHPMPDES